MSELSLQEQVGLLLPYIAPQLHYCEPAVARLVGERLITGYTEYGSNLFNCTDTELQRMIDEEQADQIIYQAEMNRREFVTCAPRCDECAEQVMDCLCPASVQAQA